MFYSKKFPDLRYMSDYCIMIANHIVTHGSEVHAQIILTFSFLIMNDAAPLRSCLGSLSPPRRLRLVVPWFSCWVMSDGEDGSAELQLQMTREVSACTKKLLLLTYTVAMIIINNKTTKNKLIASEEHMKKYV